MDKELRILILEDIPTDAELLKLELRKGEIPYSSKLAETRKGFLKELKDFAPDVILSDYKLPQFDGMAALELTKELAPTIPFIIVTGSMNEETAVECMKAGAVDYVIKDHLVRIVPAVKRALEIKKVREEKTKLEEALWNSAREWRTTFDAVNYAFSLQDLERRIIRCNKAFAKLIGKPFKEIIGRNCCELLHGLPDVVDECPFLRMQESHQREVSVLQKKDQWFELIADPVFNDNGRLINAVHIVADITERKKSEQEMISLQEQLRQSQKIEAIGRLAGGIAHDFNNLLTIVNGNCQLALLDLPGDNKVRTNIEEIKKAGERAAILTRQLLAFSRRQVLEMKVIDLNNVLKDMDRMLRRVIGEDIELVSLESRDIGRVETDPGQIE